MVTCRKCERQGDWSYESQFKWRTGRTFRENNITMGSTISGQRSMNFKRLLLEHYYLMCHWNQISHQKPGYHQEAYRNRKYYLRLSSWNVSMQARLACFKKGLIKLENIPRWITKMNKEMKDSRLCIST